jgi:hypothetical protein
LYFHMKCFLVSTTTPARIFLVTCTLITEQAMAHNPNHIPTTIYTPPSLLLRLNTLPLPLLLCLHFPPRRQNHLLPPPLQIHLPFIPIRAPRLWLRLRRLLLCLLQLARQIVPCYQIRLCLYCFHRTPSCVRCRRCCSSCCGEIETRGRLSHWLAHSSFKQCSECDVQYRDPAHSTRALSSLLRCRRCAANPMRCRAGLVVGTLKRWCRFARG